MGNTVAKQGLLQGLPVKEQDDRKQLVICARVTDYNGVNCSTEMD